jgi:hypothetical protein
MKSSGSNSILRKLALYSVAGLLILYVLGVGAGYGWLHFVRKNQEIGLGDVAFFRIGEVRHTIAAQHFVHGQAEWDAKNYQAAYLYFSAGVRQDPDNVAGRLTAMRFLRSVNAANLAVIMAEEGVSRAPNDRRMIEATFDLLLTTGRERRALDLLKQQYGAIESGENAGLLQRYEVEATLSADGAPAAKQLLGRHPDLLKDPQATRVVARVLWETQERLKAIDFLQRHLAAGNAPYADFAQLAGWQEAAGQPSDALKTARRATELFPREIAPRMLLIEMVVAESPGGTGGAAAMADFLRDFGNRPEALPELAFLAGRKGWVDLSRAVFELAANGSGDLTAFALAYSDALAHESRYKEARRVLTDLESQMPDNRSALWVQLRQRQVIAAAALGDSDNVREYARRLASLVNRDPDGLESCRRIFQKLGIADAVKELSGRSIAAGTPAKT